MPTDNFGVSRVDSDNTPNLPVDKTNTGLVVTVDRDFVVSCILSVGISAALIVFVVESFLHPTEANVVVPLLGGPVVTLLVHLLKSKKK